MKKIIAANWKMYKNPNQTREFFKKWKSAAINLNHDVIFFLPAICLEAASTELQDTKFSFGAQNSYFQAQGAFTGEISAQSVKDLGGKYILLGHSERRQHFAETDELIAQKVKFVQTVNLAPMLCIGETLEQREKNQTDQILTAQLQKCLSLKDSSQNLIVAYEPVWAIGTGKVAGPEQVTAAHTHIKKILKSMNLETVAVLYGGSVKAENCVQLSTLPGVDGFLVGGASLEVDSFLPIAQLN